MNEPKLIAGAKDWPEDLKYENGSYFCHCLVCNSSFFGHKRREVCRECATPESIKKEIIQLKQQNTALKTALSLHHSMVLSGEEQCEYSEKMFRSAMDGK